MLISIYAIGVRHRIGIYVHVNVQSLSQSSPSAKVDVEANRQADRKACRQAGTKVNARWFQLIRNNSPP